jgi:acetolactate synthase, small subunit (EC 2.2.1.6)
MTSHTLSVLVENRAGVLSRVAGMFSRRGFNIESLAVGTCEEPGMSRITIVVNGDDAVVEQVMKQTNKIIDVIKVSDLTEHESVERELALIKVAAETGAARAESHADRKHIPGADRGCGDEDAGAPGRGGYR